MRCLQLLGGEGGHINIYIVDRLLVGIHLYSDAAVTAIRMSVKCESDFQSLNLEPRLEG